MVTGPGFATKLSIGVHESTQTGQHDDRVSDGGTRPADAAADAPAGGAQDPLKTTGKDRIALSADAQRLGPTLDAANGDGTSAPAEISETKTGDPAPSASAAGPQSAESAVGVPVSAAEPASADPHGTSIDDPQATNQDSETEAAQPGNDTKSPTEADRTLGQVVDLFA